MSTAVVFISGSSTTTTSQSPTMTAIGAAKSMTVAKRTVIVLVAIAGSIGVTFVIWTVIRKWKFRPSREFEDRLNGNIDWTPSAFDDPMAEKIAAHRRNPSAGSHGSFGSSDLHNNGARATGQPDLKRSGSGRSNQIETNIPDLPPHDLLPHHDYAPGPIHSDAPGPVYNEMSRSPPGMSRLDGAGNSGLSRSATVSYGEDPYGGYTEYDDHPHGAANVAPHHAFGAAPAAQPPQPGYGVQYRGY
ncbi:uncharacterized protein EI90DRAFT_1185082 [Cantharellus anzutake]|uniref:uncharacterized protein n=1 Tax=Cantharellus anzutake TaxID=1750568 RepID=UPI0019043E92|nr:uncharacterized protein EI90DRAFT_1185082 [Cantharellus anzutake]KAF8330376.1 hypothetical protein EI90DRAFT_1185082 [Cantharellus anzutake]